MRRFLLSFLVVTSLPALASAQRGGGSVGGGHGAPTAAPVPAHAAAVHTAPVRASHVASAPHATSGHSLHTRSGTVVFRPTVHGSGTPFRSKASRGMLSQDVPGLGFDYVHLAAVGGHGRGFFSGRDRDRHRPFVAYFPFFGGGYYLPLFDDDSYDEGGPVAASDEYADGEEAQTAQEYPAPPRPADTAQGLPSLPPATAEAKIEPTTDQYVFVRRDGSLFFAVAYTWDQGNLRYITTEGMRRSASGDTLDLNATQQFNEQRGLNFRLPSA